MWSDATAHKLATVAHAAPRENRQLMDTILNYWQVTLFVPGILILLGILALVTNLAGRK
jgi:hypothetical protein